MKIGIIADEVRGIGPALLAALSRGGKWLSPTGRMNRAGTNPFYRKGESAPDLPRHWHNRDNPEQVKRIQAAADRREHRAAKLELNTLKSSERNQVHLRQTSDSLLPFYINRETV